MNKRKIAGIVTICVVMVLMAGNVGAQLTQLLDVKDMKNKRIGTASGTELLIPVGARGLAMSGAVLATTSGINSIFWNPGGLARMNTTAEGMFSTMSYLADIQVNYGAAAIRFGSFGVIGFSMKALSFGDIKLTTVDDPEGVAGRTYSPNFVVMGLTYARQFTDAITVGATFKLISEQMHRVTGQGFAMDIGVQYQGVAGIDGVNLAVVLKNVGPQISYDGPGLLREALAVVGRRPAAYYQSKAASWELPTSVELGLAYDYNLTEGLNLNLNGSYANNSLALDSYKIGGEAVYSFGQMAFAGRGGVDLLDMSEDDEQIFGPTFGFGLVWKNPSVNITIDYSYRMVDFFNNNNMISVILGF